MTKKNAVKRTGLGENSPWICELQLTGVLSGFQHRLSGTRCHKQFWPATLSVFKSRLKKSSFIHSGLYWTLIWRAALKLRPYGAIEIRLLLLLLLKVFTFHRYVGLYRATVTAGNVDESYQRNTPRPLSRVQRETGGWAWKQSWTLSAHERRHFDHFSVSTSVSLAHYRSQQESSLDTPGV